MGHSSLVRSLFHVLQIQDTVKRDRPLESLTAELAAEIKQSLECKLEISLN